MNPELDQAVADVYANRDRTQMQPTIEAFQRLAAEHPEEAQLLYEVAGAYDTAGNEETAAPLYEQALSMGLSGDSLLRCLLQYGSTLRNLRQLEQSIRVLDRAAHEFPESMSVAVFRSFTLLELGRCDVAVGALVKTIAAHHTTDLGRYAAAVTGNSDFLLERDAQCRPRASSTGISS